MMITLNYHLNKGDIMNMITGVTYPVPKNYMSRFLEDGKTVFICQWQRNFPQQWQNKIPHPLYMNFSVVSSFFNRLYHCWNDPNPISVLHPVALTFHVERNTVVENPVENSCCNRIIVENLSPLSIRFV